MAKFRSAPVDELVSARRTVFAMVEPLIALSELWIEAGNEITPGWRESLFELKFGRVESAAPYAVRVAGVVEDEDRHVELATTLLVGFLLDVQSGTRLNKARAFIKATMGELFELAASLGMSKSEADEYISGYMQTAGELLKDESPLS